MKDDICRRYSHGRSRILAITLDKALEEMLKKSLKETGNHTYLSLPPRMVEEFMLAAARGIHRAARHTARPVFICDDRVRPALAGLLRWKLGQGAVLSRGGIADGFSIQSIYTITCSQLFLCGLEKRFLSRMPEIFGSMDTTEGFYPEPLNAYQKGAAILLALSEPLAMEVRHQVTLHGEGLQQAMAILPPLSPGRRRECVEEFMALRHPLKQSEIPIPRPLQR